jgi:hypothetical protein
MRTSDKGMAPQESPTPRDPAQRERTPMDTRESSAPHAHPSTEDQDHPHACLNGYIYLSYTAFDEQTGEEVERVEALPCCRRCASEVAGR